MKRVMIIGPNGVGKTKMAYDLARKCSGEIVNLDRTYLYKGFPITTGLQDTLKEKDVIRHLYELLEPFEESPPAARFAGSVLNAAQDIIGRGWVAIAEGGSTVYVPYLLEMNAKQRFFDQIIGLRFPEGYRIESDYRARIDQAFDEGLVEELNAGLSKYHESFLIKECHFAVPTIKYIGGEISLADAKEEILIRCLAYQKRQLSLFSKYSQVNWIKISGSDY
ncbi:MAG: hypothetical protein A4S09_09800 [Proteobacteria bacterium SG_bin7]|nr:MAG: hypothetical protein A4S09_09800 [Proteobacteria bacterium SG_bin7]